MFKKNLLSLTILFALCEHRYGEFYYGFEEENFLPAGELDENALSLSAEEDCYDLVYLDDSAYEKMVKPDYSKAYKLPNTDRQYLKNQP
jgi:hypothetical protein